MAASPPSTVYRADIAPAAALMADRTRAMMLTALLDGQALAAGELAQLAGVSPATASTHLARLLDGGLVARTKQGRHHYYRLAGHEVAAAIESLSHLGAPVPVRSLHQSREVAALAEARTCYDHLAGRAGVALLDALLARAVLTGIPGSTQMDAEAPAPAGSAPAGSAPAGSGLAGSAPAGFTPAGFTPAGFDLAGFGLAGHGLAGDVTTAAEPADFTGPKYAVTETGTATLAEFGVDVPALRRSRRGFAGACLDWTQRRPHLNGALGAAITARLLDLGWIERGAHRRSVRVSPAGREGLAETFGWATSEPAP